MRAFILDWIKTIVVSLILAFIILMFVRPTLVMEYSMYPTIEQYDYLLINKIAYKIGEPKHGDVIVFKSEILRENGKKKQLIKRIIGIPGDTIEIKEGSVYRNGEILEEPYIHGDFTPGSVEPIVVESEELFVMGDNRPSSMDSRNAEVGMVSMDKVMGKAFVRLYPFSKIGKI